MQPGDPDSKFLKNAKLRFRQSKILFSIAKLHFLQFITIYFGEHNHRLKIENFVVADEVLINVFAIVACRCDTTTSPVFLILKNLSILSCRQIVDLESI